MPVLDGRSLHNQSTDFESVTWMLLASTPAIRRYKGSHCHINTHEFGIYSGGGAGQSKRGCWRSQNLITDSSTTRWPILNLSPGHHWARCQLHGGIKDVTVVSIFMKLLSTQGGGPGQASRGCWRSQGSKADSSTTSQRILNLSPVPRWAQNQLHVGIRYVSVTTTLIEIAHPSDNGL